MLFMPASPVSNKAREGKRTDHMLPLAVFDCSCRSWWRSEGLERKRQPSAVDSDAHQRSAEQAAAEVLAG